MIYSIFLVSHLRTNIQQVIFRQSAVEDIDLYHMLDWLNLMCYIRIPHERHAQYRVLRNHTIE